MAERPEDALDEDALEASTVIERRKGPEPAGPVRLSPLQPLARVNTQSLTPPAPPQLHLVAPEPPPAPPASPPLQLLRSGTEPARPLSDPRPTGSARRLHGRAARPAAGPGSLRLVLVGALAFGAGVLARDLWAAWRSPPLAAAPVAVNPVVPPPTVAPPAPPPPAAAAASQGQKRRRGRNF